MDDASAERYRAAESAAWRSLGAEPVERWVDVPLLGTRVRVLDVGDGPPVLLVHGLPAAGSIWVPLVVGLHRRRALVVDRPGCGLSPRPGREWTATPDALVAVQAAVLDGLGIDRADLVGNSFGGASVLWLARMRPDRVDHIVLEGVPAVWGVRPTRTNRIMSVGPVGRWLARRGMRRSDLQRTFREMGHRRLVESGWPAGPALAWGLSLYNDTDTLANETDTLHAILGRRGFRMDRLFDPDDLRAIDRPTLWLWGAEDPYARVAQGRAWAASMPDATFEVLGGSGHLPWLDDPDAHARQIETFLSTRPAEAGTERPRAPVLTGVG